MAMTKRKKKEHVNYYLHREMAEALDRILQASGPKYNIKSRSELIGRVLQIFIGFYEQDTFTKATLATTKLGEEIKKNER